MQAAKKALENQQSDGLRAELANMQEQYVTKKAKMSEEAYK